MFLWLVILVLILVSYLYSLWTFRYWKNKNIIFPKPVPFLGNIKDAVLLRKSCGECVDEIYNKYPNEKFVGYYQLLTPTLMIRDPELIKQVLIKDFEHFTDRGFHFSEEREPLSAHLINLSGNRWRRLRQKLTPTFSSGKIKQMFPLIIEFSEKFIDLIKKKVDSGMEDFEMRELTAQFFTDLIGVIAFGLDFDSMTGDSKFREMGKKVFEASFRTQTVRNVKKYFPWLFEALKMRSFPEDINSFFINIVKELIDYRKTNNVYRNDFIQLLIELQNKDNLSENSDDIYLNDHIIAAQAFIFFIAGFDTSSSALSYCLFELAKDLESQNKAYEEVREIYKKYGSITYEAILEMPFLDNCLRETLRLYPATHYLIRVCTKPYMFLEKNLKIEKDVIITIPVHAMHRDPKIYKNPELFLPERFNDKELVKSCIYLPFGDGPRACIARRLARVELKAAMALFLLRFSVRLTPTMSGEIKLDPTAHLPTPVGGIRLTINTRNS